MRGEVTLEIGETPPSFNTITGRHHRVYTRAKKSWEEQIVWSLIAAKVPKGLTKVEASCSFRFARGGRRDPGNFTWLVEKALGDALSPHDPGHPHRWLPDDTADYFVFRSPGVILDPGKPPRTFIHVTWEKAASSGDAPTHASAPALEGEHGPT